MVPSMRCTFSLGYVTHKMFQHAIDLYRHIKNPSEINALLLFNACAQVRTTEALELVKEVSSKLSESFYTNAHGLTSLVDALMQCGDVERAESIFTQSKMKSQSMYGAMMKGMSNDHPVSIALLQSALQGISNMACPRKLSTSSSI